MAPKKGAAKQKQGTAKKLKEPSDEQPLMHPPSPPSPHVLLPSQPRWSGNEALSQGHSVALSQSLALKDISKFFATLNFKSAYNQLQRRLVRKGQLRHPMQVFEDPSNQALLVKLQELGSINLWGDNNNTGAHSMQLAVSMQQHFANPEPGPSTPPPAKRSKRTKAEPEAAEPT
ncbi:hypothetical protein QJQ45_012557 [Haematococcus lacustris]|nr:hypothetical protein QJQ45_012467 [Haematococcus lacustris]KAJ9530506.1 hypothetical protein QJQ45_012557 [Haematococcus lacustris]